jgi:hypothetical protein
MIHLRFEGVPSEADLTLGPAPWFRVAGNFVRQGPDGDITAIFRNHYWEVQGRHYISISATSRSPLISKTSPEAEAFDWGLFLNSGLRTASFMPTVF